MPITINGGQLTINGSVTVNNTSFSIVQFSASGSTTQSTTPTITFTGGTPTAGNMLILAVVSDTTVASVAGSWNLIDSAVDFSGTYLYYRIAGASEPTVVRPTLAGANSCTLGIIEINGLSVLDAHKPNTGQGTASVICGPTVPTTASTEMAFALVGLSNGGTAPPNVSSYNNGFSILLNVIASGIGVPIRLVLATKTLSGLGTQTTTATLSATGSANNSSIIATFK